MRGLIVHGGEGCPSVRSGYVSFGRPAGPRAWLRQGIDALRRWRDRSVSRAQLSMLDERLLRDIGLDPAQAAQEIRKPFWRA